MTEPNSPARRRAEAAFSLLSHTTTPLKRAEADAQAAIDERAQNTLRLRAARLERASHAPQPIGKSAKRKSKAPSK